MRSCAVNTGADELQSMGAAFEAHDGAMQSALEGSSFSLEQAETKLTMISRTTRAWMHRKYVAP